MEVPMLISDFLRRGARLYPDRDAFVSGPLRFTYRQFQERVNRLSHALLQLGVGKGDRVALLSPNAHQFLECFWGVTGIGAVLVPLNYRLIAADFVYILNHSGAAAFLADGEMLPVAEAIRPELGSVRQFLAWRHDCSPLPEAWLDYEERLATGTGDPPPDPALSESDLATLNYTSGTTALPKGVMLTHRNVYLNALNFIMHLDVNDRDTILYTVPLFHANGWGSPFAVAGMGGRHVVLRKVDAGTIFGLIETEGVTLACMAPTVLGTLLNHAETHGLRAGPGMRVVVAGSPPPPAFIQRLYHTLGWRFIQVYGLTETSPFLTVSELKPHQLELPEEERCAIQARAGMEMIGVDLRVVDEAGADVPADDRTIGEVVARGNVIMQGYWRQPEETERALAGGWFRSGDLATRDAERSIHIVDRKKDVIISGGENISSAEVEDALYQHPAVLEACVIGVPHQMWGETVKALVVLRDGHEADEAGILGHCRARLAHFKCPTSVDFLDALPRTATGKLQKYLLRERYWASMERRVH